MIEISVTGLQKSFDLEKKILDGLTFQINSGERVGLLGKNGAGKTTLFRILTGEIDYDAGEVAIASDRRVGLISQIPVYPAGYTVEDVLQSAFERMRRMADEMERLSAQMANGDESEETLRRYGELSARFEGLGGYDTATAVNKVANGLSIPADMRTRLFDTLSGGEKTRVNLGRLILEDTDILLLDEPTNHLDLHAIEWLEEYLASFKGTVVAISHDRYFLDRTITRVIEILDGHAEFYNGNYSFYAVEKERRYLEKMRQYEKEQAKIRQLEAAADKLHLWAFMGNDALHKRAFSMEKRIERMRTTDKPTREKKMTAQFRSSEFLGDEVLTLKGVGKSFGERTLFSGVDLKVAGGERIALIGDNGTGKSTLIKMIMGEEYPDEGRIKLGPSTKIAYLPQIIHFDVPQRDLVDTMLYSKRDITPQKARDRLAAFHFRGEDVFKSVSVLSGGEQSRLRLCMLMDDEVNFLILDEPTNHLDIASREWIEEAVEAFDGTLLFVSHDRYFINRFATRVWELEEQRITDYPMGFARYRKVKAEQPAKKAEPEKTVKEKSLTEKPPRGNKNQQAARRQLTICEREIAQQEEALAALDARLEEAASDYEKYSALYAEKLFVLFVLERAARRGSRAAVWGRRVLRALLAAGFVLFAALETMVIRGSLAEKTDEPVSAVIVLGAGVNGETPSLTLRTRIDAAAAYLEEHPDVPVILSGGQGPGEAITEAECMRRALVRRGADESRLYPEERSTSTQENLRYSRAILEELGVDPAQRVAIVTSDFHLCRARLMWGGDTAAVPAHLPSALYFQCLTVNYFIREAFGLAAYFVYGG